MATNGAHQKSAAPAIKEFRTDRAFIGQLPFAQVPGLSVLKVYGGTSAKSNYPHEVEVALTVFKRQQPMTSKSDLRRAFCAGYTEFSQC